VDGFDEEPSPLPPPAPRQVTPVAIPTPVDPIERYLPLGLKMIPLAVAALLLWQAAANASMFPPGRMAIPYYFYYMFIILPIHEGGHFLFMFFGYVLHVFGGSFWQVMMPVLLFIVALRQHSSWAWVWLALAGVHMISLSPYIYDAPYRVLPLLGPKHGHDWHNLLSRFGMMEEAEGLADGLYWLGVLTGIGGLGGGMFTAFRRFQSGTGLSAIDD
jgi:hypothetical protein